MPHDIKILVAAHKRAPMPQDDMYLPTHVGKALSSDNFGYTPDNTGDNISAKNKSFCELTGIYWAWKNLNADFVGLVHYRRLFVNRNSLFCKDILSREKAEELLASHDVILPKQRHYYIETTRGQYEHAHNPHDLIVVEDILKERHPQYLSAFAKVMSRTYGHRFNMFIMKRELFNNYCEWLFDVLFELEKRIDTTKYNKYNSRVFGFISERLLDVWVEANNVNYTEQKVIFTERQNWPKKIYDFLIRKFRGGVDFEN